MNILVFASCDYIMHFLIFDDVSLKIGRLFYFLNADYKLVTKTWI